MFKVFGYLDQWETFYVSEHASESLRSYRGKEGLRDGCDGEFVITELGYSKQPGERPRLVQLFTMAKQPWAALLIGDFLRVHAGDPIAEILKAGNRASLGKQISLVFKVSEQVDARFRGIEEQSENISETKKNLNRPRQNVLVRSVIPVLASIISAILLILAFRMNSDNEGLHSTNVRLKAEKEQLSSEVSSLTEEKDRLGPVVRSLETTLQQLESKNSNLGSQIKAQSEKMQKGQWGEIVKAQIIEILKGMDSGNTRDEVVHSVRTNLPAIDKKFIEESLKELVKDGEVFNRGLTEFQGDYRLKASNK